MMNSMLAFNTTTYPVALCDNWDGTCDTFWYSYPSTDNPPFWPVPPEVILLNPQLADLAGEVNFNGTIRTNTVSAGTILNCIVF
jgi:hypothetical protein